VILPLLLSLITPYQMELQDAKIIRNKRIPSFKKGPKAKQRSNEYLPKSIFRHKRLSPGQPSSKAKADRDDFFPTVNISIPAKKVPEWLDLQLINNNITFERCIEVVLHIYPDFMVSDQNWYQEITRQYFALADTIHVSNQGYEIKNTYFRDTYSDFSQDDFEWNEGDFMNKIILCFFLKLLSYYGCEDGIYKIEDFITEYYEFSDTDDHEEGLRSATKRNKKIFERERKFIKEELPVIKSFGFDLFNDLEWIVEFLYYKGYDQTSRYLWTSRHTIELIGDMMDQLNETHIFHQLIYGFTITKPNEHISFLEQYYDSIEPEYTYVTTVDPSNPVLRSHLLFPYLTDLIHSIYDHLVKDWRIKHGTTDPE
jgi:hypothetical protein